MIRILAAVSLLVADAAHGQVISAAAVRPDAVDATMKGEVVVLDAVASRDANGRVETFTDARRRHYRVTYGAQNRVSSIRKREDRIYVDDILDIGYADDGRLVSVRFGDGNVWVFSYGADGMEYVQDRYGTMIARQVSARGEKTVVQKKDPKGTLGVNLSRLDGLLAALNSTR